MSPPPQSGAAFWRAVARAVLLLIAAGAGMLPATMWLVSTSPSIASPLLLGDIALVCVVGVSVVLGFGRSRSGLAVMVPWLACGALGGAGLLSTLRLAPYVLMGMMAFAALTLWRHADGKRPARCRTGSLAAAALVNFLILWPFTLGQYRPVSKASYLSLALRAHTLVADVPVHDVWHVHLPDSTANRTLLDVNEAMESGGAGDVTVGLAGAAAAYQLAALVFGLTREACADTASSMRRRLTDADRARSVGVPGRGGFVYHFEREALLEIQTCTAHAIYVFALEPEPGGYGLYWAVYAKRVSWFTPIYMRLIEPMRRLVVYPSLLQRFERRWRVRWRAEPGAPRT